MVKKIDYVDSASGLLTITDYLASSFGLIGQDNDAFPFRRIRGALIDSIRYGAVTSVEKPERRQPEDFVLHQNYPNPFNPSTTIHFELSSSAHVELAVFNTLGQKLRTLVDEHRGVGGQTLVLSGQELASGIYLYRLKTNRTSIWRKMVVVH